MLVSASIFEAERYISVERPYVIELSRAYRQNERISLVECVDLDDANEVANALLRGAPLDVYLVAVRPATIEQDAEWVAEELLEERGAY